MKITAIIAGNNARSNCAFLADTFLEGMQKHGECAIETHHLANWNLEQFSTSYYDEGVQVEQDFTAMQNAIERADGLLIATPVWNFSVPAHLKNMIDRMGSFALDETHSKGTLNGLPFYVIYTGGAPLPAWKGLMQSTTAHVPEALKYFGGSSIGHHFEGKCTAGTGVFDLVVDKRPESLESVALQGAEFAKVVEQYVKTGNAPAVHRARSRFMRIGEWILKKF